MGRVKELLVGAGLEVLAATRMHHLVHLARRDIGVILRVTRVRRQRAQPFQPNAAHAITPQFLEAVLASVRRGRLDIISLDEMHRRLVEPQPGRRRFVCFTCDGGYVEHRQRVLPIFRKYDAPFAALIPTAHADGLADLWWLVLEEVIRKTDRLALLVDGREQRFDCRTTADKTHLFDQLSAWLWARPTNEEISRCVRELAARYGVDGAALSARACMGWPDIAALAADPLVTIGAQGVNHLILAKLPDPKVRSEMAMSRAVIESALGKRPVHFAFPFGGRDAAGAREFVLAGELGFNTALTSQSGVLVARNRSELTALPRVTLNGHFQRLRYLPVLLAGIGG